MHEFTLTGTALVLLAWLVAVRRWPVLRPTGVWVVVTCLLSLGLAITVLYVPAGPVVPALRSYWLVIRVFAALVAAAGFSVAMVTSALLILRRGADRAQRQAGYAATLPSTSILDGLTYKLVAVSFPVWTFAVVAGAIWAEMSWGRYWGWDPKEVWALVTWLGYAAYLHAPSTAGWQGQRAAVLNLLAYATLLFNFLSTSLASTSSSPACTRTPAYEAGGPKPALAHGLQLPYVVRVMRAASARGNVARSHGIRSAFTRGEWRSIGGMTGFVLLLHVVGWSVLLLAVAPRGYQLGDAGTYGVGVGLTAYLLGVRHAFDADHIASIDNTTRKLVGEGKPAVSTGFWFSLGHSSVVFLASLLLAIGVRAVAGVVQDEGSRTGETLGLIGTLVAGSFLVLIGLTNLVAVVGIAKVFRQMRAGEFDEVELERQLNSRGFLARLLGRLIRRISKPWHLYPVGLLMGLGFDTATQVALLVLAAGSATFVLPWYAILVLPVLFAAGMSLFDTADGVFMSRAYGWAFLKPIRKVFYNLTVTVLSVTVALVIGSMLLVGLLVDRLEIGSGPLAWLAAVNLDYVGFGIVGLFVLTWVVALAVWRLGRIEERWSEAGMAREAAPALVE